MNTFGPTDVLTVCSGSAASGESVETRQRHPGGEGVRRSADSAPPGLRRRGDQPGQRRPDTGDQNTHTGLIINMQGLYWCLKILGSA